MSTIRRSLILGAIALMTSGCASATRAGQPSSGSITGTISTQSLTTTPSKSVVSGSFQDSPFTPPDAADTFHYSDQLESAPIGNANAQTTPDQAIEAAKQQQPPDEDMQPGLPSVTLRMVSEGYAGQDSSAVAHPAWVLTWMGGRADVHGPATLSPSDRAHIAKTYECIAVTIVDASSLEVQGGMFQFCRQQSEASPSGSTPS